MTFIFAFRRWLLLLALSCRFSAQSLKRATNKKHNIFSPEKEREKTKEEKRYTFQKQCSGGCQGFFK
jgi:hypothetical protein